MYFIICVIIKALSSVLFMHLNCNRHRFQQENYLIIDDYQKLP